MTVHLFTWHDQTGGGLQAYSGMFESVEQAEAALVKQMPPAYAANFAQTVGVKPSGELYCLRNYRRNRCWFDEGNTPHIDASGVGVWIVIGESHNPMAIVPGQRVQELVR